MGVSSSMSMNEEEEYRSTISVLSVAEIAAVLGQHAHIGSGLRRSKSRVLNFVLALPKPLLDDVIRAATAKQELLSGTPESRKRQREADRTQLRRVRRRLEEQVVESGEGTSTHAGVVDRGGDMFLQLPSEEQRRDLYRKFYEATSSVKLKDQSCAICARSLNVVEADIIDVPANEIPNQYRLRPARHHEAHQLIQGMLLCSDGCREEGSLVIASVCRLCRQEMSKSRTNPPRLSLANGLWVGEVPWQLQRLSFPEQLLIAHLYPRLYVIKLYPKDRRAHAPDTLQSALAGNVTTFAFNMEKISDMISGQLMPQRPAVLASVLSVTYVGSCKPSRQWLKSTFNVRRFHVGEALRWLKEHNPKHYGDVIIDGERMQSLPEDDVPLEILANVHHEEHTDVVDVENDTYVPPDTPEDSEDSDAKERTSEEEPTVIPLQYLGVMDTDLSQVSMTELMQWGLANLTSNTSEGRYLVRHGRQPVGDFPPRRAGGADSDGGSTSEEGVDGPNFWAKVFPVLFPYGLGGIEAARSVSVSFLEHVQWLLQYHDHRFRKHPTFTFLACGIQQRRQALGSARIQMRRSNFAADAHILSTITLADLTRAAEEESAGQPISSASVRLLKKRVHATASRVFASDVSRIALRSQIWSTTAWLNPPNVWITINPDDLHDPIAQVFVGEQIDMDAFSRTAGPDKAHRARSIASDGFAAARFFHFVVKLVLETLFGLRPRTGGKLESNLGVLGHLSGYFGTVECQGRGTLHLHLLVWLKGSPTPSEMCERLQQPSFRERMKTYIRANFRASIPGAESAQEVLALHKDAEVAYSRPVDPAHGQYWDEVARLEAVVARTKQLHVCGPGCLVPDRVSRQLRCKRRAPWPLSTDDTVDENGQWSPKRTFGYLNAWVPAISQNMRCNNDGKLLTNSRETNNITFYITNYTAKKQGKTYNSSALWAKGLAYHFEDSSYLHELHERQRLLLFRAVNVLNREQELPAPMAVSYLMGWGDVYRSHHYAPVYWTSFLSVLLRTYPELRGSQSRPEHDDMSRSTSEHEPINEQTVDNEQAGGERQEEEHSESYLLTTTSHGRLAIASQVEDYQLRGHALHDVDIASFFANTYEQYVAKSPIAQHCLSQTSNQAETEDGQTRKRGRPASKRVPYLADHPRHDTVVRVIRGDGHNTLPNFVGSHFPRNDDPETYDLYCASMLLLFKPWREVSTDLKHADESSSESFQHFKANATKPILDRLDSIQHYHACKAAADAEAKESERSPFFAVLGEAQGDEDATESDGLHNPDIGESSLAVVVRVTEDTIQQALKDNMRSGDRSHGAEAVRIAEQAGLFSDIDSVWQPSVTRGDAHHVSKLHSWQQRMSLLSRPQGAIDQPDLVPDSGDVASVAHGMANPSGGVVQAESPSELLAAPLTALDVGGLKEDQRRAYDIIKWHLQKTIACQEKRGERPLQLLMHLHGEGGTGKSRVIQTVTELFEKLGVRCMLLKAAYTGIAASLIDGKTTHAIAGISMNGRRMSEETRKRLTALWTPVRYLIIDEVSMLSRAFFATLSRNISLLKNGSDEGEPFGGVNVVICGDFHQFPPVASKHVAALYYPNDPSNMKETVDDQLGRSIYESFRTVVILQEQVRVEDTTWRTFLTHLRTGDVDGADIEMLRSLVLTNPRCVRTDLGNPPWSDAVLVTPRHAVRTQWNEAATRHHCARTGVQLFSCPAEDTVKGRSLSLLERLMVAQKKSRQSKSRQEQGGLPHCVDIAIGMKVMVTLNVDTELDVANGTRGEIVDIVLDPREPPVVNERMVTLHFQPLYILVKLDHTKATGLTGLPANVIPIQPLTRSFQIQVPVRDGSSSQHTVSRTVARRQLPLTAAYAFTDYRAQGQTITHILVDIASPPSGSDLTLFNIYVALSRSKGRQTIRLLRDFDERLLFKAQVPELEAEDEQLRRWDKETKVWWTGMCATAAVHGLAL